MVELTKVRNPDMRKQLEEAFEKYVEQNGPITGNTYFVDDSGSSVGSGTMDSPIDTIDNANNLTTANNGDKIFVFPNHAEDLASATACVLDTNGVEVIGLGEGENRPKLTVKTAADAGVDISGNGVIFKNFIIIVNKDGATQPVLISGSGCKLDIEIRDTSNTVEANIGVLTEATADYLDLNLRYVGFTDGSGNDSVIRLVGSDYATINVDYFGQATTALVEMHTTSCKNVKIFARVYNQGMTNYAKHVIDTAGSSTWIFYGQDGETGANCSGSQDSAIAAADTSGIATIDAFHDIPTQDSADNSQMRDVIGNKTDTVGGDSIYALALQILANEGSPAGTDMSTDIAAIKTVVDAISGYVDTEVAAILNAVNTEVADILTDTGTTIPATLDVPTADTADNSLMSDVVGNKNDTVGGTSAIALLKQVLAALVVIDAFHDVPAQNSSDNAVVSDVLGNKTDTTAGDSLYALALQIIEDTDVIGTIVNAGGTATLGALLGDFANSSLVTRLGNLQTEANKIETPSDACKRQAGKTQIFTKNITSAANAGVTTVGTITTQSCMINRIVLKANGVTTADLTSAAIEGGASQVVEYISAATAVTASINADDEQVSFSGASALDATKTITIDLQGTGATAVDLDVIIEYCACEDGGYIA